MVLNMQGISSLPYNTLSGIQATPAMYNAAKILAEMGREEDIYIVHAAEGETVIPMEVMEANPKMAEMVYTQLREMGLEPERYIVGNELNSINPETGMPEFFLSKLWSGIKKVAKIVLPILATVALTVMGVPPPVASAIVSGANTMIQGGDFKDGLKAAATGYVVGAATQAVAAGVNAPQGSTMGERISAGAGSFGESFTAPFSNQDAFTASGDAKTKTGSFTDEEIIKFANSPEGQVMNPNMPPPVAVDDAGVGGYFQQDASALKDYAVGQNPDTATITATGLDFSNAPAAATDSEGNLLSQTWDAIRPGRDLPDDASLLTKWGPSVGLGTLGVAAAGGFDEVPLQLEGVEEEFQVTGDDLLTAQPAKYGYNFADFVGGNPYHQRGFGSTAPPAPRDYSSTLVAAPPQTGIASPTLLQSTPYAQAYSAAAGGPINGAGTGKSDSIPAMLSDGEFVFTAKAVRGAGNGDRIAGAREMYRTMKRLEGAA